jgi:hypothetical protein
MKTNLEKMKLLSRDLQDGKEYPRSPRETRGAEIIASNNKERQLQLSAMESTISVSLTGRSCHA